jgi:glycosyltransferase involved in cell wall biosynthesis
LISGLAHTEVISNRPQAISSGTAVRAWRCSFAINGRFFTQETTGVQRYAREIVGAIDANLSSRGGAASLIAPVHAGAFPKFKSVGIRQIGPGSGQLWEQLVLPLRHREPLLNLCNTAPAFGGRQVVCIHDANVFTEPNSYSRSFRLFYQALQPRIARRAARVTSVSKSAALQLSHYLNVPLRRVEVLPNGYEHVLRWRASRSTLFDARPPRRPYVLLLGSRAKHKNVDRIVGLAEALDALGLDIIIAGGDASIFAQTAAGNAPTLRWLGRVSDDDLALLFSRALCLAFPSLTEGFGLPVIEAMALGCPVVASDRASLPEVCGSAALLADPTEASCWIKHFAALAGSRELRTDLRARGAERITRFSWSTSAAGYLDLFGH